MQSDLVQQISRMAPIKIYYPTTYQVLRSINLEPQYCWTLGATYRLKALRKYTVYSKSYTTFLE